MSTATGGMGGQVDCTQFKAFAIAEQLFNCEMHLFKQRRFLVLRQAGIGRLLLGGTAGAVVVWQVPPV
jgi:hypothetical protein